MKAIVCHNYGPPDVVKLEDIEKPTTADDEVLIKVRAASVNPVDRLYRGRPYMVRMLTGLGNRNRDQACDFAILNQLNYW